MAIAEKRRIPDQTLMRQMYQVVGRNGVRDQWTWIDSFPSRCLAERAVWKYTGPFEEVKYELIWVKKDKYD